MSRPDPGAFDSLEDYCHALRGFPWLTPAERACMLQLSIDIGEESIAEAYAQYRSECALFGDAGPGQGLALREMRKQLAEDRAALARVSRIAC